MTATDGVPRAHGRRRHGRARLAALRGDGARPAAPAQAPGAGAAADPRAGFSGGKAAGRWVYGVDGDDIVALTADGGHYAMDRATATRFAEVAETLRPRSRPRRRRPSGPRSVAPRGARAPGGALPRARRGPGRRNAARRRQRPTRPRLACPSPSSRTSRRSRPCGEPRGMPVPRGGGRQRPRRVRRPRPSRTRHDRFDMWSRDDPTFFLVCVVFGWTGRSSSLVGGRNLSRVRSAKAGRGPRERAGGRSDLASRVFHAPGRPALAAARIASGSRTRTAARSAASREPVAPRRLSASRPSAASPMASPTRSRPAEAAAPRGASPTRSSSAAASSMLPSRYNRRAAARGREQGRRPRRRRSPSPCRGRAAGRPRSVRGSAAAARRAQEQQSQQMETFCGGIGVAAKGQTQLETIGIRSRSPPPVEIKLGRPTPSMRCCPCHSLCSMAWRFSG